MTPSLPLLGLRLGALQPVDAVGYQQVLVATPGEAAVTQGALRGSLEVSRFALDVTAPWVYSSGGGYTDGGMGRVRVAAGGWIGTQRAWQVGLELAAGPDASPPSSALAWATRARDVLPGGEALLYTSWAHPEGWVAVRAALGIHASTFTYVPVAGDLAAVVQLPLAVHWAAVAELDLCADPTWFTARPAIRYAKEPLSVDVGLQLPWPALKDTATFQPFAQVRWWGRAGPTSPLLIASDTGG